MKLLKYTLWLFAFVFIGCNNPKSSSTISSTEVKTGQLPYFTYKKENLFPGNGSLLRAEDGVSLKDGRIIVVDQAKGLRLIEKDGSNRPFGNFAGAGFLHLPPKHTAGPNGIILELDGAHILMSDVSDGKIYRTNIVTEKVEMIYDHPYGVNTIYSDKTGAIWFSQSAESINLGEMFMAANLPVPTDAVFRMNDLKSVPVKIMDSLYSANGITMDTDEKHLFMAENMMARMHKLEVDIKTGEANYIGVAANVGHQIIF